MEKNPRFEQRGKGDQSSVQIFASCVLTRKGKDAVSQREKGPNTQRKKGPISGRGKIEGKMAPGSNLGRPKGWARGKKGGKKKDEIQNAEEPVRTDY